MKNTLIITLLILYTSFASSQETLSNSDVKTTFQEYIFLTETLENADDPKTPKGYKFEQFKETTIGSFNFNYRLYIEESTSDVKAVSVAITKLKKKQDKKRFLCIPFNNGKLLERFIKDAEGVGPSMAINHDMVSKVLLSFLFDYIYNVKK